MTASRSLDGQNFDLFKAKFAGAVELMDQDAIKVALGDTVVMVIVATVKDIGVRSVKDEIHRVANCSVTDARVLEDSLKEDLVNSLGLYGADTSPVSLFDLKDFDMEAPQQTTPREDESPEEWRTRIRRNDTVTHTRTPSAGQPPAQAFADTDLDGQPVRVGLIGGSKDPQLSSFLAGG
jgi:hypothetical protein